MIVLRFAESDLPVLSGYLHDSFFTWDDVRHDRVTKRLTIRVDRPCYETPHRTRLLGILPVVRYKTIPADLIVQSVVDVERVVRKQGAGSRTYRQNLIEISLADHQLLIETDLAEIRVRLAEFNTIELRDVGEPSRTPRITDAFSRVTRFDELSVELDRLRSDT